MSDWVYLDGKLVLSRDAKVSIFDHGFLYGDGLFETMRAYRGKVFRIDDHIDRLGAACRVLKMELPFTRESLKAMISETIDANGLKDAYVRLTITRGDGEMHPDPESCPSPRVVVTTKQFSGYPDERYEQGYRACIVTLKQNPMGKVSSMKTTSFLPYILARMEAREAGVDEGILVTTEGFLSEGAVSNLFIVRGGTLKTPSLECGILPGITRRVVKEIARERGPSLAEGKFLPGELTEAHEAFLTNSLMEVMPLVQVDGKAIGRGKPGVLTSLISRRYREKVGEELLGEHS